MAASSALAQLQEEHPWLPRGHAPFAGKYTVERVLGQGGMGVVFEARHIRLRQRVAIKVLGSALREYPELVERFEREARAAGSLTSSHAVRVFDIDATDDGTPFIVMELLSGRDLSSIVENEGPQPVSRSVRWLIEACDAISEAHRLGIIHRDLKPSNLFLTDVEGRQMVKVLDFGIAKRVSTQETAITQAVAPLGTPQYMSPEQVRCAKDVDVRTDVWSLGVTLYEMICGQTPFAHESSSACIASIAADPVPDPRTFRPDLSDAFVAVLMRALEKNVKDRYQSVEELVAALAPFALDDSFDDEEMISAVRRAYVLSTSPKATPEPATLDESGPVLELVSEPVEPAGIRARVESRSDRTVPPAVTHAELPAPRRFRSTLAFAAAAVLGLAALVVTPRCVATTGDANAANTSIAAPMFRGAEPTFVAPNAIAVPVAAPSAAPVKVLEVLGAEPEATPTRLTLAVAVPAPVVSARAAMHPSKPVDKKDAAPALPRSGVHGGLSSPGF